MVQNWKLADSNKFNLKLFAWIFLGKYASERQNEEEKNVAAVIAYTRTKSSANIGKGALAPTCQKWPKGTRD